MANKYKKDVPDLFSQPPLSRDLFDEGKTKDENIPQQSENITIPDPLKNIGWDAIHKETDWSNDIYTNLGRKTGQNDKNE